MEFLCTSRSPGRPMATRRRRSGASPPRAPRARAGRAGTIKRLWRIPGQWANWGMWEAPDATALHAAMTSLPMWPYLDAEVHPLAAHPERPGRCADERRRATTGWSIPPTTSPPVRPRRPRRRRHRRRQRPRRAIAIGYAQAGVTVVSPTSTTRAPRRPCAHRRAGQPRTPSTSTSPSARRSRRSRTWSWSATAASTSWSTAPARPSARRPRTSRRTSSTSSSTSTSRAPTCAARPSAARCWPRARAASSTSPRSARSSPTRGRAPTSRPRAACWASPAGMALEWRDRGVRVNGIGPTLMDSPLTRGRGPAHVAHRRLHQGAHAAAAPGPAARAHRRRDLPRQRCLGAGHRPHAHVRRRLPDACIDRRCRGCHVRRRPHRPGPRRARILHRARRCPIVFGTWIMRHREFFLVRVDAESGLPGFAYGLTRDGPLAAIVDRTIAPAVRRRAVGRPGRLVLQGAVGEQRGPRGGHRHARPVRRRLRGLGPRGEGDGPEHHGVPGRRAAADAGDRHRGLPAVHLARRRPWTRSRGLWDAGLAALQAAHRADAGRVDRAPARRSRGVPGCLAGHRRQLPTQDRGRCDRVRQAARRPRTSAGSRTSCRPATPQMVREIREGISTPVAMGDEQGGSYHPQALLKFDAVDFNRVDATTNGGITRLRGILARGPGARQRHHARTCIPHIHSPGAGRPGLHGRAHRVGHPGHRRAPHGRPARPAHRARRPDGSRCPTCPGFGVARRPGLDRAPAPGRPTRTACSPTSEPATDRRLAPATGGTTMATITGPTTRASRSRTWSARSRFYRDILGFEVVFQWNPQAEYIRTITGYPDADIHAAILRMPGTPTCSWRSWSTATSRRRPSTPAPPTRARPTSRSSRTTATRSTRSSRPRASSSVTPPVTPTIGPNTGGRAVYMIDPDGIRVEFIQTRSTFAEYAAEVAAEVREVPARPPQAP